MDPLLYLTLIMVIVVVFMIVVVVIVAGIARRTNRIETAQQQEYAANRELINELKNFIKELK